MKLLVLCLISCSLAGKLPEGVDDLDDVSLEEFDKHFGQDQITDPEEKEAREEALREHEEMVKEANEAFALGEQTWYDEINEYSDLPDSEFEANHTGLLMNITDSGNQTFFSGWLDIPLPYDEVDTEYLEISRNIYTTLSICRSPSVCLTATATAAPRCPPPTAP